MWGLNNKGVKLGSGGRRIGCAQYPTSLLDCGTGK